MPNPGDIEIERKYTVKAASLPPLSEGTNITQGYLPTHSQISIRVRLAPAAGLFMLTVKGPRKGAARVEIEQEIKPEMAELLLEACGDRVIEKTRYGVIAEGKPWDVDVFHRANDGLILAELELNSDTEEFEEPQWLKDDVTDDERYYNEYLAEHPFSGW